MKHLVSWGKYFETLRLTLLQGTAFRLSFFLSFLHVPVLFLIYAAIWAPGFEARGVIQEYTFPIFMAGLMTSVVLRNLVFSTGQGDTIETHIQEGSILVYLTRPISFLGHQFAENVGHVLLKAVIGIPVLLLLHWFLLGSLPEIQNAILALILALAGIIFFFELTFISSISSFWIGESWGLRNLISNMGWLFGGAIVPVTFFPEWLRQVSAWMPFEHAIFLPSELLLARAGWDAFVTGLGILIAWTIFLFIIQKPLWEAGLRKHDGKG